MIKKVIRFLISDVVVLTLVVINVAVLFWMSFDSAPKWLSIVDIVLTLFFFFEMFAKISFWGWKGYWRSGWNRLDLVINVFSAPSLLVLFVNNSFLSGLSILFVFRTLRVLRICKSVRVMRFLPRIDKIIAGVKYAVKTSYVIVFAFFIFLVIVSLVTCSLFGDKAPQFFGDPFESMYTIFRMFTIEGWYEIPDALADAYNSGVVGRVVKFFFVMLVFLGGLLGMSFVNSLIVDAMAEDNNDEVKAELDEIKKLLEEIKNNK